MLSAVIDNMKTSEVDDMLESNKALQETVAKQSEIITKQDETIKTQQSIIDKNTKEINSKISRTFELEGEVDLLTKELDIVKLELNDLGQYGRRNSLKFNNLKFFATFQEPVLTLAVVKYINEQILYKDEEGYTILVSDVERCHPLGKPNRRGHRQIIVKFRNSKIYASKSKGHPDKVFMSEDPTAHNHDIVQHNHDIVQSLLQYRKKKEIDSFWTLNGRINH